MLLFVTVAPGGSNFDGVIILIWGWLFLATAMRPRSRSGSNCQRGRDETLALLVSDQVRVVRSVEGCTGASFSGLQAVARHHRRYLLQLLCRQTPRLDIASALARNISDRRVQQFLGELQSTFGLIERKEAKARVQRVRQIVREQRGRREPKDEPPRWSAEAWRAVKT